jgi:hypothetical protein
MFTMPGEPMSIAVESGETDQVQHYELIGGDGSVESRGQAGWTWTAPLTSGLHPVGIRNAATGESMTLNVFVMVPYSSMRHGMLDGYRIGNYPRTRTGFESEYQRPRGFVEVTPALSGTEVSPHFTLGQFVCKQPGGYPKYLVLRQPLIVKLEELLQATRERGYDVNTFSIMSAYRTPAYNKVIGNITTFSRHQYGDAADIFVDNDGDGGMDDLNHDGRYTIADARVLGAIVDETRASQAFKGLIGGLGTYAPTHEHGPFVHVDVRGFEARWGG